MISTIVIYVWYYISRKKILNLRYATFCMTYLRYAMYVIIFYFLTYVC